MKIFTKIVPYDIAEKLKANGFHVPTIKQYDALYRKLWDTFGGTAHDWNSSEYQTPTREYLSAPTYGEMLDWFSDKGIHLFLSFSGGYRCHIRLGKDMKKSTYIVNRYDTAIEAYKEGIEHAFWHLKKR